MSFYIGKLGFNEDWRHVDGGQTLVAQVAREGCALMLWRPSVERTLGPAMIFISLKQDTFAALTAALAANGVASREGWWGYRVIIVTDPDGNDLYFPDPADDGGS